MPISYDKPSKEVISQYPIQDLLINMPDYSQETGKPITNTITYKYNQYGDVIEAQNQALQTLKKLTYLPPSSNYPYQKTPLLVEEISGTIDDVNSGKGLYSEINYKNKVVNGKNYTVPISREKGYLSANIKKQLFTNDYSYDSSNVLSVNTTTKKLGSSSQRSNEIESISTTLNTNFDAKLKQFYITALKHGSSESNQDGYSSVTKVYNQYGLVIKAYSSNKSSFEKTYDNLGRLISLTDVSNSNYPLATKVQYINNVNERKVITTAPNNSQTIMEYNDLDQPLSKTFCTPKENSSLESCFTLTKNVFSETNQLAYTYNYQYDENNNLARAIITNYEYDIYGRLYSTYLTKAPIGTETNATNIGLKAFTLKLPAQFAELKLTYLGNKIYGDIEVSIHDPITSKITSTATYPSSIIDTNNSKENLVELLSTDLAETELNQILSLLTGIFNSDGSLSNNFIKKTTYEYNELQFPTKTYLSINDNNGGNSVNNKLIRQIDYDDNTKQVVSLTDLEGNIIHSHRNLLN